MRYMKRVKRDLHEDDVDDDPMSGMANLFDIGLVFIVALLIMLFSAYRLQDFFDENSDMTILKKSADGQLEIITKKAKKITAVKITAKEVEGKGRRLGTAFQLEDGSTVYVPE